VQDRHSIPVLAAATLTNLITVLEKDIDERPEPRFPLGRSLLPKIRAYHAEYGI
jgi:hypothetical protein